MGRNSHARTLGDVVGWLARAPRGTMLEAAAVLEALESLVETSRDLQIPPLQVTEPTWRERLWTAPAETRIGVKELAEAVGRPKSWVYRHTRPSCNGEAIPHRKIDGELVFLVGEVRDWIQRREARGP